MEQDKLWFAGQLRVCKLVLTFPPFLISKPRTVGLVTSGGDTVACITQAYLSFKHISVCCHTSSALRPNLRTDVTDVTDDSLKAHPNLEPFCRASHPQATYSGFGLVNQDNVFRVCDQPHPLLVARIIESCSKGLLDDAYEGLKVGRK